MSTFLRISFLGFFLFSFQYVYAQHLEWEEMPSPAVIDIAGMHQTSGGALLAWPRGSSTSDVTVPMYRSTDGGQAWQVVLRDTDFGDSMFEDNNGNLYIPGYYVIWRSADGGASWKRIPSNVQNIIGCAGDTLLARIGNDVSASTDFGQTWFYTSPQIYHAKSGLQLHNGTWLIWTSNGRLFRSSAPSCLMDSCTESDIWGDVIGVYQSPSGQLLAITSRSGSFTSDDNGESWDYKTSISPNIVASCTQQHDGTLVATTSHFETINDKKWFGYQFLISNDFGNSWQNRLGAFPSSPLLGPHWATYITTDGSWYMNATGRLAHSSDQGASWSDITGNMFTANISEIFIYDSFLAIVTKKGTHQSTDDGLTWHLMNGALQNEYRGISFVHSSGTIFQAFGTQLLISTDDGRTYTTTQIRDGITQPKFLLSAEQTMIAAFTNSESSHAGDSVYYSTDMGATWSFSGTVPYSIHNLVNGKGPSIIGSYSDLVYRSTDFGATWKQIPQIEGSFLLTPLYEFDDGTIVSREMDYQVRVYDPMTDTAVKIPVDTAYFRYGGITAILHVPDKNLYVGTYMGVYQSTDKGRHWHSVNTGLPDSLPVTALALSPNGQLLAGTPRGIYRTQSSVVSVDDLPAVPTDPGVVTAYPNPFTSSTSIALGKDFPGGTLQIVDALGREVYRQHVERGTASLRWDGQSTEGIPIVPGMYYLRLTTPSTVKTNSILRLR